MLSAQRAKSFLKINGALILGKIKNLIGQRFGRLSVLKMDTHVKGRHLKWICRCDCGKTVSVYGLNLGRGLTKSCRCLAREVTSALRRKHGLSHSSAAYMSWASMRLRCYTKSHTSYKYYGARGITVCVRWRNSFENFLADMGEPPRGLETLDRIDSSKGYDPSNCRWLSRSENSKRNASARRLVFRGETVSIAGVARSLGVPTYFAYYYIGRMGMSPSEFEKRMKERSHGR